MNKTVLAACLNEWMLRYIQNPRQFDAEFETVREFLREKDANYEPSYGVESAAYLEQIAADLGLAS